MPELYEPAASLKLSVPTWRPGPTHAPTGCAETVLIVPPANPAPEAVHETLAAGIESAPLRRSPLARAVSVTSPLAPVMASTVTITGASPAVGLLVSIG